MNDFEAVASGSAMEEFDVFVNHRGPDVKATFVAHLEDALLSAGFRPFLDVSSLRKSNPALQSIDQALATAKVHIAIVSPGYAESKYCLNELVAMISSGKPVVPVFYGVEPVDLRRVENGPFAEAFKRHKERGRSARKLLMWRDALAVLAERTGFRLADYKSDEARLKQEVVNEVARLTPSNQPVEVDECRVGLEGPTRACIEVLGSMGDGVGLLGLVGMGGVGKTTLAREIYNHYAGTTEFRFMTFLEVYQDCSSSDVQVRPRWQSNLQEQLLWDLLRTQDEGSSYGTLFQRVSTIGPVFIVIDDIHSLGQFQELVPSFGVLCPGSRVIVTSRDQSVINNFADKASGHFIYEMSELGVEDANMLFNLHAFHSKDAPVDYKDIAKCVVESCGGLPLALKVMGSSLFDKRLDGDRETIWVEVTNALRACEDVMGVLRWSYERLNECEKLMFIDITCLFDAHSVEEAFAYWESCKHSQGYVGFVTPYTSLRNLVNKSLVRAKGIFKVHGLLRELGQRIAMNAKRHLTNDDFLVDEDKVETIGVNLVGCRKRKFKLADFGNMPNLHVLRLPDGCKLDGDFGCMPKKLRLLQWRSMPLKRLSAQLNLRCLESLDLSNSTKLVSIWTESNSMQEGFVNLQSLNLRRCTSITRLPDLLGQSLQLQYLELGGCENLKKLPFSIGQLKALKILNLEGCSKLESLPHIITCPSLTKLRLIGCTSISKLPNSIGQLGALEVLDMKNCSNLKTLPDSIACPKLTVLRLSGCTSITKLPEFLGQFLHLSVLSLQDCKNLRTIPDSIGQLKVLKYLYIDGCRSLKTLPHSIGQLKVSLPLGIMEPLDDAIPQVEKMSLNLDLEKTCDPYELRIPTSCERLQMDVFYEELSKIDNISEIPMDRSDLPSPFTGITILCCYNAKESSFEFFFNNREDMAQVVGVGLEFAKAVLIQGWKVHVRELTEEDWGLQKWNKVQSSLTMVYKLLSMKVNRSSSHVTNDEDVVFQRPLLWDLAKYFTLQETIATLEKKKIFAQSANTGGASSSNPQGSSNENDQGYDGSDESNLARAFGKWYLHDRKENGEDNEEGRGRRNNEPEDPPDLDIGPTCANATVSVELLSGGSFDDVVGRNDKVKQKLESMKKTIVPNMEFTFTNQGGEKDIQITIGRLTFALRHSDDITNDGERNKVVWSHYDHRVSFGLEGVNVNFGEVARDSFKHLDTVTRTTTTKSSQTTEKRKGQDNLCRGEVLVAPQKVGARVAIERKNKTEDSDMQQHEISFENEREQTTGGLWYDVDYDPSECKVVCQYFLSKNFEWPLSPRFKSQELRFQATWNPHESVRFAEYTLKASRILQEVELKTYATPEINKKRKKTSRFSFNCGTSTDVALPFKPCKQTFAKKLLVNHEMSHLDGKTHKVKERVDNQNGLSYFSQRQGGRCKRYLWEGPSELLKFSSVPCMSPISSCTSIDIDPRGAINHAEAAHRFTYAHQWIRPQGQGHDVGRGSRIRRSGASARGLELGGGHDPAEEDGGDRTLGTD